MTERSHREGEKHGLLPREGSLNSGSRPRATRTLWILRAMVWALALAGLAVIYADWNSGGRYFWLLVVIYVPYIACVVALNRLRKRTTRQPPTG